MLGGSTGLNLLGWDRASKAEYDSWALFSTDSPSSTSSLTRWDFESLFPYFKKSENVDLAFFDTYPGLSKAEYGAAKSDLERIDGNSGPVQASIAISGLFSQLMNSIRFQASYNSVYDDLNAPYVTTWNNLHVPTNPDAVSTILPSHSRAVSVLSSSTLETRPVSVTRGFLWTTVYDRMPPLLTIAPQQHGRTYTSLPELRCGSPTVKHSVKRLIFLTRWSRSTSIRASRSSC